MNSRLTDIEECISDLEDRIREIIQSEQQTERQMENKKESNRDLRCESRAIKKAEHQRTDTFELWCWRRLLRVPWTARRSNQSVLKKINPENSLEGLMLKLRLQYLAI